MPGVDWQRPPCHDDHDPATPGLLANCGLPTSISQVGLLDEQEWAAEAVSPPTIPKPDRLPALQRRPQENAPAPLGRPGAAGGLAPSSIRRPGAKR